MARSTLSATSKRAGDRTPSVDAIGTAVNDCLVLIVGTDGKICEQTSGDATVLTPGKRDLRNLTLAEIWPADIAKRLQASIRKAIRSRGTYRMQLRSGDEQNDTHHEVLILAQGRDRALMICKDLTESKNLEKHVRDLAFSDPLTQLPNRAAFLQQLGEAISVSRLRGDRIAIMRIFLDGIKFVNLTFGRAAGNAVVREAALRMEEALEGNGENNPMAGLRAGARLARTAGDEYTLLLPSAPGKDDMTRIADFLIASLTAPYEFNGNTLQTKTSIGIAEFPQDASDIDTLLANAGVALYESRASIDSRKKFFSGTAQMRCLSRMDFAQELRWALENEQFSLSFQPCFDIRDDRIVSAEALLRWHHPLRGLVPLSEIMPVVEMNDLSEKLGDWVLRNACAAATSHRHLDNWKISLNLSSRQAFAPLLVENVLQGVEEYGLTPGRIQFEIREADFFRDSDTAEDTARRLVQRGFDVILDDCGVGTLSVQSVVRAGVTSLKISRSIIAMVAQSDASRRCCAAIIAMARELGVAVSATGVETQAQYDCLRELGCQYVQGYLFSQPVTLAELAKLLTEQHKQLA